MGTEGDTPRRNSRAGRLVERPRMKMIDIVLPVYNEEAILTAFHASLVRVINKLADKYRLD